MVDSISPENKRLLIVSCIKYNLVIGDYNKCIANFKNLALDFENEDLDNEGVAFIEPGTLAEMINTILFKVLQEEDQH
jgi:hypothetical protein